MGAEPGIPAEHTLRGIPQGELDALRKKIAQAGGKVIILVHPYWLPAQNTSYKLTIEKLLKRSKVPVIIIEESHRIQLLKEKLAKLKAPNCTIIASSGGRSDIWLGVPPNRLAARTVVAGWLKYLDTTHEAFAKFLKEMGGRTVLVGGMQAGQSMPTYPTNAREYEMSHLPHQPKKAIETPEELHSPTPFVLGCAGDLYNGLIKSGHFEVRWLPKAMDLPRLCAPYTSPYPHPSLRRRPMRRRMGK